MPKAVVSSEGNLRDYNKEAIMENRDILDVGEMMWQGFENRMGGVEYPQDDGGGRLPASSPPESLYQQGAGRSVLLQLPKESRGHDACEKAVAAMLEVKDDLSEKYAQVCQDRAIAGAIVSSIRKIEASVRDLGGETGTFDPAQYSSGLKQITAADPMECAKKVAVNTKTLYAAHKIDKITVGKAKDGRPGIGIWISGSSSGKNFSMQGRIVAKADFSGTEAIDYVKDEGKGRLMVKNPRRGLWEDVTSDYDVAWQILKDA